MIDLLKRNWDILSGLLAGLVITVASGFDISIIQLTYSALILVLVSIGLFRVVKQAIDKNKEQRHKRKKERQHNLIDEIVDTTTAVKAINLASKPTKEGERLGQLLIEIMKRGKKGMKDIKTFLDKFKGFILAFALAALSIIEQCGGYLNAAFGDALTVNGVELLPIVTLVLSVVVGCISNGFTKEQVQTIKTLFTKKPTNELVTAECKARLKASELKLKETNKLLLTQENELESLESQLVSAMNTHEARKEMYTMVPRLATEEQVQEAANHVVNTEAAIVEKKKEIEATKQSIDILNIDINALKARLHK